MEDLFWKKITKKEGERNSMGKCEICNREEERYFNKKRLCMYHYWVEKGRPNWVEQWKEYKYSHPVRVSYWRKHDKLLDKLFGGQ